MAEEKKPVEIPEQEPEILVEKQVKIRKILLKCPNCGEDENWYYDKNERAYLCAKCEKIFYPERD